LKSRPMLSVQAIVRYNLHFTTISRYELLQTSIFLPPEIVLNTDCSKIVESNVLPSKVFFFLILQRPLAFLTFSSLLKKNFSVVWC